MAVINLKDIQPQEIAPGFHARFVHTNSMTIAHVQIDAGATLPEHSHVHEQVVNLIDGTFELTVEGESILLEPGKMVTLGSNVPHSGRAITDCRIIDVFHPVREDYRRIS